MLCLTAPNAKFCLMCRAIRPELSPHVRLLPAALYRSAANLVHRKALRRVLPLMPLRDARQPAAAEGCAGCNTKVRAGIRSDCCPQRQRQSRGRRRVSAAAATPKREAAPSERTRLLPACSLKHLARQHAASCATPVLQRSSSQRTGRPHPVAHPPGRTSCASRSPSW